jgi:hypothetical protein
LTATDRFDAAPSLAGLAPFQRRTVDHVFRRFYEDAFPTRRFLVADETGLGKSLVGRGLVARTIERLQDDPSVPRIDILYVCSNADIARQNVRRLDVIGHQHAIASRLTLLARGMHSLDGEARAGGKAVNLVSFTPGTLPGRYSWATGTLDERALIHVILSDHLDLDATDERASMLLFQGTVQQLRTVQNKVWWIRDEAARHGGIEPTIASEFVAQSQRRGLLREYRTHLAATRGKRTWLPHTVAEAAPNLIAAFRTELARASVHALEPDLIILDEFQRFRELLDRDNGSEAADLAHALFEFGDARVLLLSATPIKSFTFAEESLGGDDHERDLRKLLDFLTSGSDVDPDGVVEYLAEYRRRAIGGHPVAEARTSVETALLSVMCRTERPRVGEHGLLAEECRPVDPDADDLVAWVGLHRLASAVDGSITLDYWKSAPYFVNFIDGYQVGDKLKERLTAASANGAPRPSLDYLQLLDRAAVAARAELDLGNARLRAIADATLGQGQHLMLWVPPSMPYHRLGGPFEGADLAISSKLLIFSSWAATPTAVASLLSHEADRQIGTPPSTVNRLQYRMDGRRPGAMTALPLFWPNPELAELCDPRRLAGTSTREIERPELLRQRADGLVRQHVGAHRTSRAAAAEAGYWQAAIGGFGRLPSAVDDLEVATAALEGATDGDRDPEHSANLRRHVELALATTGIGDRDVPPDLTDVVAQLGMYAPGNVAWRSLGRLLRPGHGVTPGGHWRAAAVLASGFRSFFNRAEAVGILDRLGADPTYWRAVLVYCGWGDLQALLDEHVHHAALAEGITGAPDDDALMSIAEAVHIGLTLRPSPYSAFDPLHPARRIPFSSRFALRYGTTRQSDEGARLPEIRAAFNSPFWPWVLATTSVGQEGIDFHWWCSSIVHWNIPSNPVDFEQREGRVNRYGGLAIRRNLATRHRAAAIASADSDPWVALYELGHDEREHLGELAPHWVYPGPARIRRTVLPYPLSSDEARYQRLKDDLTLYRLTFGQPRQEDLLEILRRNGVHHDQARIDELQLRLAPSSA